MSPTAMAAGLEQYAPQAVSLFQNMVTPASIIAGAIVPLALASPLPIQSSNPSKNRRGWLVLRRAYNVAAMLSLVSNLIAVMWSIVTVNQLTEMQIAPAASVFHLLRRDFDLPWTGVNSHFLFGLMTFAFCVGCRAYLQVEGGTLGKSMAGLCGGALLIMMSIINRAVAQGAGDGVHRYGPNVIYLFARYVRLLAGRATAKNDIGILGVTSIVIMTYSLITAVRAIFRKEED